MKKDEVFNFGGTRVTGKELVNLIIDIQEQLKGRKKVDLMGSDNLYQFLTSYIAPKMKVKVNYIPMTIDDNDIINKMISDTLVITTLPMKRIQTIVDSLYSKKEIIFAKNITIETKNKGF